MSDSFREPVAATPEAPTSSQESPQAVSLPEGDKLQGNESPATDELTVDEKNVDVWEGLHRTKFIESHFKIKEFAGEFPLKMQVSHIDKYIKNQIAEKQYENNIENYEKVLQEIEEEAGSERLETFTRLKRISEYIKVLNKFNALKEKKASFKALLDG